MNLVECSRCGSKDLTPRNGHLVCAFCRSEYIPNFGGYPKTETVVDVLSDIQALLQKCELDPSGSRRYANLILDIDPTNQEAAKYLQ